MSATPRFFGRFFGILGLSLVLAGQSQADLVYFQVAELPGQEVHGDSFVLPLSNPADISHARALISQGPEAGATNVFAQIAKGADQINRDLNAAGQPLWAWHITQFEGFGDFGIELLDGWPTYVESDVQGWIDNTNSRIGFWNYTVVGELPEPPASIPLQAMLPAGFAMFGGIVCALGINRRQRR